MRELSLVLIAACLCGGCTTPRSQSETGAIVADILREKPSNVICPFGKLRYCVIEGDGSQRCECTQHRKVFPDSVPVPTTDGRQ